MSVLGIVFVIIHVLLSVGLIYFSLQRMQKNSELGGAFGSGASSTQFGREKGFDPAAKMAMWFGIFFMVSCFVTTIIISR